MVEDMRFQLQLHSAGLFGYTVRYDPVKISGRVVQAFPCGIPASAEQGVHRKDTRQL